MAIDFEKINEIKKVRVKKEALIDEERSLSRPMLENLEHIKHIYDLFRSFCLECNSTDQPENKRIFIFIIIYMYSPSTLAGEKLKNGIRDELTRCVGYNRGYISTVIIDLVFIYQKYKGFKGRCDMMFDKICEALRREKIIN